MERLTTLWLYEQTALQRIFSPRDLLKEKKRQQQLKNLISRAKKQKRVKRIWHNLYHIVPFENPSWEPTSQDIARYLCNKKEGHLFFLSALEAHGLLKPKAKSVLAQERYVWIRAKKAGTAIEKRTYDGMTYIIYKQQKKQLGLITLIPASGPSESASQPLGGRQPISCTDKEETFLECLDWVEDTLENVRTTIEFVDLFKNANLDFGLAFDHLEKWDSKKMNAKAGLILELLGAGQATPSHAKRLEKLLKSLSKKPYYFRQPHKRYIGLAKEHFKHIRKWNLMVPNSLFSLYELEQKKPKTPEQEAALVQATLEEVPAPVEVSYTTKVSDKPEQGPETEKEKKEEKQA